ncbi:ImmA/IrrE family metallo-endopeptidase [Lachnoclostridium phytofermentans]|uniref:ImmA/IrrE family metallo-endopeptidase n=1 Tax=Lachnoclostridium phytofermentans TaxID=66219 RepID=UPI0004961DD6|nr:ImmA/IrrE family metallo-endopeptidase [Lachnoclostridium phytofermentans]
MEYEELLDEAFSMKLKIKEVPLRGNKGRIIDNHIYIKSDMIKSEKLTTLAEEIGHYETTVGDILNQDISNNVKQEIKARYWSYDKLIGLHRIIDAYNARCLDKFDIADYLNVPLTFLESSISYYRSKYGCCIPYRNYIIFFDPSLAVLEKIDSFND